MGLQIYHTMIQCSNQWKNDWNFFFASIRVCNNSGIRIHIHCKIWRKKIGSSIWGKLTKYDDLVAVCSYKRKLYLKVGIDTLQFQGLYFMKSPREILQNLPYFGFLIYQKYSGRVTNFDIFSLREHFIGHKQP